MRACDVGGWTDTWFAGHGAVFHVAVGPGTTVEAWPAASTTIEAPDLPGVRSHPLLEAACSTSEVPARVRVTSAVPPGASLGTSASVVVALLGALDALAGRSRSPAEVAAAAHRVETELLGLQSGVQDQLAAAHGGAELVTIERYPSTTTTPLASPDGLVVVFLGRSHVSSAVHEQVIAALDGDDRLEPLRAAAHAAADAARRSDWPSLGAAMRAANEGQRALHPALVSDLADAVGALADRHGALGWKVNGAGGDGGSVSVLLDGHPAVFAADVAAMGGGVRALDLRPSAEGLVVETDVENRGSAPSSH